MQSTNKPKKTIKVEISLDLDWDNLPSLEDIERDLLKKIDQAKKDFLKQILTSFEDVTLPQSRYLLKDRRAKRFQTILGEIEFPRYRVFDRQQKKFCCPIDDWLNIANDHKVCGLLKNEIIRLAVDVPFRFVAREINHWTNNQISKDTVWGLTQNAGQKCWEDKSKLRRWQRHEPLPTTNQIQTQQKNILPAEILCIGLDGTFVKKQTNKRRVKTKHDVKVAVLYTGKKKIHGDMHLENRQTVIQGRSEKLDAFLGRVVNKAITHYGLNQNTTVLLFGDGDVWIKKFKEFVPQAHYRLDPWHVLQKIKLALDITDIPKKWIQLVYGQPEALIAEIKTLQNSLQADPVSHQKIKELTAYLQNNKEGLLPWQVSEALQNKHKPLFTWGSGHVESQIEVAVYDRHKLHRMSWSTNGLNNLSTLREDKLNHKSKPNFTCSQPKLPTRITLGSLGCLILPQ